MEWLAQAATAVRSAYGRTSAYLTLGNLVSISWISIWVVICVLIFQDLSRDLVTIEPIATPKSFAEGGYTPEVASRRLHDALNQYARDAGTMMQNRKVESREELPDFIVPKIDLSLNAIVASIRGVLHYNSGQRITGEFVSHDKLLLRLRVDGQEVFSGSGDPKDPDQLLTQAAPAVIDKIRPYVVAVALYDVDSKQGEETGDYIINHLKPSAVNVEWSYILKGICLADQKRFAEAEEVLRTAVSLNWYNANAHNNLASVLDRQQKPQEAIRQYELAIALDPGFAEAHFNLAISLDKTSNTDGAIAEYQQAIKIDPKDFDSHFNLANIWYARLKLDAATREYKAAIEFGRIKKDLALAHVGLGNVLSMNPDAKIDEAVSEYRLAIESDPNVSVAHANLGRALRRQQGKLDEAISQFQLALVADKNDARAKTDLESALRSKQADAPKQ